MTASHAVQRSAALALITERRWSLHDRTLHDPRPLERLLRDGNRTARLLEEEPRETWTYEYGFDAAGAIVYHATRYEGQLEAEEWYLDGRWWRWRHYPDEVVLEHELSVETVDGNVTVARRVSGGYESFEYYDYDERNRVVRIRTPTDVYDVTYDSDGEVARIGNDAETRYRRTPVPGAAKLRRAFLDRVRDAIVAELRERPDTWLVVMMTYYESAAPFVGFVDAAERDEWLADDAAGSLEQLWNPAAREGSWTQPSEYRDPDPDELERLGDLVAETWDDEARPAAVRKFGRQIATAVRKTLAHADGDGGPLVVAVTDDPDALRKEVEASLGKPAAADLGRRGLL